MENFSTEAPACPTGKRGRPGKVNIIIDKELDYAVVHKTGENGKVVKVEKIIILATKKELSRNLFNVSAII
jgi:hypothetical protein